MAAESRTNVSDCLVNKERFSYITKRLMVFAGLMSVIHEVTSNIVFELIVRLNYSQFGMHRLHKCMLLVIQSVLLLVIINTKMKLFINYNTQVPKHLNI